MSAAIQLPPVAVQFNTETAITGTRLSATTDVADGHATADGLRIHGSIPNPLSGFGAFDNKFHSEYLCNDERKVSTGGAIGAARGAQEVQHLAEVAHAHDVSHIDLRTTPDDIMLAFQTGKFTDGHTSVPQREIAGYIGREAMVELHDAAMAVMQLLR